MASIVRKGRKNFNPNREGIEKPEGPTPTEPISLEELQRRLAVEKDQSSVDGLTPKTKSDLLAGVDLKNPQVAKFLRKYPDYGKRVGV